VTDLDAGCADPPDSGGADDGITALCRPTAEGSVCEVVVGRDPGATRHTVSVSDADLARLAPGHHDPEDLVLASFRYLLAREPREAILPRFGLTVIERHFPGYEAQIRAQLTPGETGHHARTR
jgi:hypothetical protein